MTCAMTENYTPGKEILMDNLKRFQTTWKDHFDNNDIQDEVSAVFKHIEKHINMGCLSNIPPSAGPN